MSEPTTSPIIEQTKDLNWFKRLKGNREVKKTHVRKLKEYIQKDPKSLQYTPILINEKREVLDGQHRLEAVRQLNEEYTAQIPVYYIVYPQAKLKTAQAINSSSKPWTPNDYAESFRDQGNEHYVKYLEFKARFKLNHDVLLSFLGLNNPISSEDFKDGIFEVEDEKASLDLCQKLTEVGQYYPEYKKRSFALAFKMLWQDPQFNWDKTLAWFAKNGAKLKHQPRPSMYWEELKQIIN